MLYFISSSCPALCDAIPLAIHDEEGDIEDVRKTSQTADDILDGWRYGMKSMLSPTDKPREVEIAERLAKCGTAHDASMMHRFLRNQWTKKSGNFSLRGRKG